jgi:hypothetical protein
MLLAQFDPWIAAWEDGIPKERARRATDKTEAAGICEATSNLKEVTARLAYEKANPSGVVDLEVLHTDGQMIQALTQIVATRKKLFVRDRKKSFLPAMCVPIPPNP